MDDFKLKVVFAAICPDSGGACVLSVMRRGAMTEPQFRRANKIAADTEVRLVTKDEGRRLMALYSEFESFMERERAEADAAARRKWAEMQGKAS